MTKVLSKKIMFLGLIFLTMFFSTVYADVILQKDWSLHYVDSEELGVENRAGINAFDGNASTFWHTEWKDTDPPHPHEIQIDLGKIYSITGFRYSPRQDGNSHGRVAQYEFYVSINGSDWGDPVATGVFPNNTTDQEVTFSSVIGKFIKLRALSEVSDYPWTTVAEINVLATAIDKPLISLLITWDPSVSPGVTSYDLRLNKDNSTLISIPSDLEEWSDEFELLPGKNVFDMRAVATNDHSVWSNEAYYIHSIKPAVPTNLQGNIL